MAEQKKCHVVGVAGTGMNALAQMLLAEGWEVTGSDRYNDQGEQVPVLGKLIKAGIKLVPQDGTGVTGPDVVVAASGAVEDDNLDIVAARKQKAEIVPRARMLARLAEGKRVIAVGGTCGKTTVTGMLGWMLENLGADPTVINGGSIVDWVNEDHVGNVRIGKSDMWVLEADESDKSLLEFDPDWAIITNMSKDHFDLEETEALFKEFAAKAASGVVGGPGSRLPPVSDIEQSFGGASFRYRGMRFEIKVPGMHNVENAVHAIALCDHLGYDLVDISEAVSEFRGIERRLQVIGDAAGFTVIDDFGHNPAKIRAAWESVAPFFERVCVIWRPHGFGPLAFMMDDLIKTFKDLCRENDSLCVLPVYYAGGTANKTVTSWRFVGELRNHEVPALCAGDYKACIEHVTSSLKKGDAVMVMGARDPNLPQLARQLAAITVED